jgi:hypothetical protein
MRAHFEGYIEDVMREALEALNPSLDATPLLAGFHNPWADRVPNGREMARGPRSHKHELMRLFDSHTWKLGLSMPMLTVSAMPT